LRSRRRRLDPGRQALPALARLAAGFEIGVTTAWRYVREAIDLLAASTDDLATAMNRIRLLAQCRRGSRAARTTPSSTR
jgi:hypothetical protein